MAEILFAGHRFIDENGNPISGGKLYVYADGTTTPLDVYINTSLTTTVPNPVVLSSGGMITTNGVEEGDVYLAPDVYKFVLRSSDDAITYFTIDGFTVQDPDTASAVTSEDVTTNTTISSADLNRLFSVDTASGDVTITANAESLGSGFEFTVKKSSSDVNQVIVIGTGAQTIDGASSATLNAQYDTVTFRSLGASGWSILSQTLDTAQLVSDNAIQRTQVALNAGRLVYTNSTTITLLPYKGGYVCFPDGTSLAIGSSGKQIGSAGLTIGTTYYIYAYSDSGMLALEASTTGHSAHSSTGIEIKTGDASRVLVGMVHIVDLGSSTPGFADSATRRLVATWNNARPVALNNSFSAERAYSTAGWNEINTEIRVAFLSWPGAVYISSNMLVEDMDNSQNLFSSGPVLDGGPSPNIRASIAEPSNAAFDADDENSASCSGAFVVTEGYHYATVMAFHTGSAGANYTPQSVLSVMAVI